MRSTPCRANNLIKKVEEMVRKIIFWISISLLAFWILSPMYLSAAGLESNHNEFEQSFEKIRFWGVPLCVFLACLRMFKKGNDSNMILKVILTLGATIFSYYFMIMTIFAGICGWTNIKVLYINKENERIKIISREYGCGVFDSESVEPILTNFKVQKWGEYFIKAKEINIEEIDETKWKKKQ